MFELIHQLSERLLSQFAVRFLPSQAGTVPATLRVVSHLFFGGEKKQPPSCVRTGLENGDGTNGGHATEQNKRERKREPQTRHQDAKHTESETQT